MYIHHAANVFVSFSMQIETYNVMLQVDYYFRQNYKSGAMINFAPHGVNIVSLANGVNRRSLQM